jgi:tetratricopeptide (TPR) repeat protein
MLSATQGTWSRAIARVGLPGGGWRSGIRWVSALLAHRPFSGYGFHEQADRSNTVRYHLGRARRAREAGDFEQAVREARRALEWNGQDPWVLALLGQCLFRKPERDLPGARAALERAWSLDPTNGYFVGLLLDVLDAQGDVAARHDLLTWAWWRGAPVERWLPDGPLMTGVPRDGQDVSAVPPAVLRPAVEDWQASRRDAVLSGHG